METTSSALKSKPEYIGRTKQQSAKLSPRIERDEKMLRFEAARTKFRKLLPALLNDHEGKYAAIIDDHVEINDNEEKLFKAVMEQYGYKSMYIGQITREQKVAKMRSPRIRNR